ncbi:hypothetical protein C5D25_04600, partial [Rathayibacter sp. AY1D7]|uniref:hypothetical protein n=1 Tax=Rathayibacter sp. AY1D7 TaxID=2080547 RepID=UPI000D4505E3
QVREDALLEFDLEVLRSVDERGHGPPSFIGPALADGSSGDGIRSDPGAGNRAGDTPDPH